MLHVTDHQTAGPQGRSAALLLYGRVKLAGCTGHGAKVNSGMDRLLPHGTAQRRTAPHGATQQGPSSNQTARRYPEVATNSILI
ncbi:uncharacterized protein UV8b_03688 [Ustilaginoidea virens]|uniref:Uncharacterized protein n=1 Tax=Ustilaginoidea virens TaxID=1159556 RepID=A0A8E5MHC5_USTVR|nr:uncharacterized protein UV8b_03688 [Ustilaginoidea virens]QUC19447.1 hypothetical protein UV8b_03688 [Ustilaginoidea virens]